jgi:hypothetical protein
MSAMFNLSSLIQISHAKKDTIILSMKAQDLVGTVAVFKLLQDQGEYANSHHIAALVSHNAPKRFAPVRKASPKFKVASKPTALAPTKAAHESGIKAGDDNWESV